MFLGENANTARPKDPRTLEIRSFELVLKTLETPMRILTKDLLDPLLNPCLDCLLNCLLDPFLDPLLLPFWIPF